MKVLQLLLLMTLMSTTSCTKKEIIVDEYYTVSGKVIDEDGHGIEGVDIMYGSNFALTNVDGNWEIEGLLGQITITPLESSYNFIPEFIEVNQSTDNLQFVGSPKVLSKEQQILNWFRHQQMSNGLLQSTENNNVVSLYDQALSAMVFLLDEDFERAEMIFDFFDSRISSELMQAPGGFSQFRDKNGIPGYHRWMGDNAWFLIAINNYKALTGNSKYDQLSQEIANWLVGLQDNDGGLYAGYASDNSLLNFKVTEGNIDAFNAIDGYTSFHKDLLNFLENQRWDDSDKNLMSWPENPPYKYALDNHSWSYCMFPDYPLSSLTTADRFKTTQTATVNGNSISGYDIDEDKDAVFIEGTGQMVLAFHLAGMHDERDNYLEEMEKVFIESTSFEKSAGFPYASNIGTGYGDAPLWSGADTEIAISGGAWYLFALFEFNPFEVGKDKNIPSGDMFWID